MRNSADVVFLGDFCRDVDVDFDEVHVVLFVVSADLFKFRMESFAPNAPFGAEFHDDVLVFLANRLKFFELCNRLHFDRFRLRIRPFRRLISVLSGGGLRFVDFKYEIVVFAVRRGVLGLLDDLSFLGFYGFLGFRGCLSVLCFFGVFGRFFHRDLFLAEAFDKARDRARLVSYERLHEVAVVVYRGKGNCADLHFAGNFVEFVDVDIGERDVFRLEVARHFFEFRAKLFARGAPRGAHFNDGDLVVFNERVELLPIVNFDEFNGFRHRVIHERDRFFLLCLRGRLFGVLICVRIIFPATERSGDEERYKKG